MGSPLAPVIASLYMEQFQQQALNMAEKKPSNWYRYVDDTFVVWPHGEELQNFLQYLNSLHPNIQFTMETEKDDKLVFLDVLVKKKLDGLLGHTMYRKPTHTDLYLHANSEHHPTQKQAVMSTLVHQAKIICDTGSLEEELQHLQKTFRKNGYSKRGINHTLKTEIKQKTNKKKTVRTALLPYQCATSDKISRLLAKHIRTIHVPTRKTSHLSGQ